MSTLNRRGEFGSFQWYPYFQMNAFPRIQFLKNKKENKVGEKEITDVLCISFRPSLGIFRCVCDACACSGLRLGGGSGLCCCPAPISSPRTDAGPHSHTWVTAAHQLLHYHNLKLIKSIEWFHKPRIHAKTSKYTMNSQILEFKGFSAWLVLSLHIIKIFWPRCICFLI